MTHSYVCSAQVPTLHPSCEDGAPGLEWADTGTSSELYSPLIEKDRSKLGPTCAASRNSVRRRPEELARVCGIP